MILRNKFFVIILILSASFSLTLPKAEAFTVADIEFNEEYLFGEVKIRLNAAAPMTFLYTKMAAVGLYLEKNVKANQAFESIPKRMEFAFLQHVNREKMIRFMTEGMIRNIGSKDFEQLKKSTNILDHLFDDIKSGDRISVTYLPDVGTKIEYNGIQQEIIKGVEFANAFFSVYIGVNPANHRTKAILFRDKSQYKL